MARVTVEDCLARIPNQFELTLVGVSVYAIAVGFVFVLTERRRTRD